MPRQSFLDCRLFTILGMASGCQKEHRQCNAAKPTNEGPRFDKTRARNRSRTTLTQNSYTALAGSESTRRSRSSYKSYTASAHAKSKSSYRRLAGTRAASRSRRAYNFYRALAGNRNRRSYKSWATSPTQPLHLEEAQVATTPTQDLQAAEAGGTTSPTEQAQTAKQEDLWVQLLQQGLLQSLLQ